MRITLGTDGHIVRAVRPCYLDAQPPVSSLLPWEHLLVHPNPSMLLTRLLSSQVLVRHQLHEPLSSGIDSYSLWKLLRTICKCSTSPSGTGTVLQLLTSLHVRHECVTLSGQTQDQSVLLPGGNVQNSCVS